MFQLNSVLSAPVPWLRFLKIYSRNIISGVYISVLTTLPDGDILGYHKGIAMPRTNIVITISLVLGILLRTLFLGAQSLEMDELFTAESMLALSVRDLFTLWILPDPHLPLHALLLWFWVGLFGDSEISLRMPSAIFGVLALFACYNLGNGFFKTNGCSHCSLCSMRFHAP